MVDIAATADGLPPPDRRYKLVVMCDWSQAPHLTPEAQARIMKGTPPWQRGARARGIPALGAGAIFPVPEEEIKVDNITIPDHWPRGYAMDVGWNRTAGLWRALDRDTGISYLYREHYRGEAEPSVHAAGFRAAGDWIPGRIDPAANGRSQEDGKRLIEIYRGLGLHLENAANAREAGLTEAWERFSSGRLKVCRSLSNFFAEYRMFRRNDKGQIIDERKFHLMAALRYSVLSGDDWLKTKPEGEAAAKTQYVLGLPQHVWMR